MKKFTSVVGARPQFVKLAPICQAFSQFDQLQHTIIHTGQHYDDAMSTVFFEELQIPSPDINLQVGSGGHGAQTGKMLQLLENQFIETRPDVVVVYGDTNSTLAASLTAAKMHIPVAHIEAGIRSFNREMPEEINRVATDHCSEVLYAPTPAAIEHLRRENLAERAVLAGDVMRDTVNRNLAIAESRNVACQIDTTGDYGVLTLHRPANTDPQVLMPLLRNLSVIAERHFPLLFPVHPRIRSQVEKMQGELSSAVQLIDPLPYLDMLKAVQGAQLVITDSGGLQKEAAFLGTQCVTIRSETEWVELIDIGINRLTGSGDEELANAVEAALSGKFSEQTELEINKHFGDGQAAKNIVEDLASRYC